MWFLRERLPRGPDGGSLVDVLEIKDGLPNREHAQQCVGGLRWTYECGNSGTQHWGKHFPRDFTDLLDTKMVKTGNPHKLVVTKKPASARIAELKEMMEALEAVKVSAQGKSFDKPETADGPKTKRHKVE